MRTKVSRVCAALSVCFAIVALVSIPFLIDAGQSYSNTSGLVVTNEPGWDLSTAK